MILIPLALGGAALVLTAMSGRARAAATAADADEEMASARERARRAEAKAAKAKEAAARERKRAERAERKARREAKAREERKAKDDKPAKDDKDDKPIPDHGATLADDKPAKDDKPSASKKRRAAANKYLLWLTRRLKAGKPAPGSKKLRSQTTRNAQKAMGKLAVDGIYGPKTEARVELLTGDKAPSRSDFAKAKPAKDDAPSQSKQRRAAARKYRGWLLARLKAGKPAPGSKSLRSKTTRNAQKAMGKLAVDGIYGRKTEARVELLTGKTAPSRGDFKSKPAAAPKDDKPKDDKANAQRAAAVTYRRWLVQRIKDGKPAPGSKRKPSATTSKYQKRMGKLAVDGIYGRKTEARVEKLTGRAAPSRADFASKPAAAKDEPPEAAQPPADEKQPDDKRSPREAADALWLYVTALVRSGRGDKLGSKDKPNAKVKAAQSDMRKIKADGIYGPKTRSRGRELLGREFPPRHPKVTAPREPEPEPEGRTAKAAALALYDYATAMLEQGNGAKLGIRGAPSPIVRDAQADMGEIEADGFYGPATRARGAALTGRTFPIRR